MRFCQYFRPAKECNCLSTVKFRQLKKILIIQTAFIGDVVLATALAEKLHERFTGASIDFMLRKGNESLLAGHPFIRKVLVWDKKRGKYRDLFRLWKAVRREKYDLLVNVQRFAATGLLSAFSEAGEVVGFDKNPFHLFFTRSVTHVISTPEHPIHEVDRNQKLIEHLAGPVAARPRLYPTSADRNRVKSFQEQPYVCVAPASVWFTKQYPATKWVELLNRMPAHIKVFIIGAPGDAILANEIRSLSSDTTRVENLCGRLSLLESTALQSGAMMNYVNDSAPMHFASAVNAPVTAVYCSTLPSFGFGPLADRSYIVQTQEKLSCRPCGLHGKAACPEGHFKCAYTIPDSAFRNPEFGIH